MATICQVLSTKENNLWAYQTADGRSIEKGIQFLYPFVDDKSKWKYPKDVMYWDEWPVAQPFLIFGAVAYRQDAYKQTWKRLNHDPSVDEVIDGIGAGW